MHYAIECASDLVHCFPDIEENFPEEAHETIFQHLLELHPDSAITDDDIAAYEAHETLKELADFYDLDFEKSLKEAYEEEGDPADFPAYDEDGEPTGDILDFDELTDCQRQTAAEELSEYILKDLRHQLEKDDIIVFELLNCNYLTYDPTR